MSPRLRVALERAGLVALGLVLETLSMPPGPAPVLVLAADAPFLWLLWHRGGKRWGLWAYLYGYAKFVVGLRWLAEVHPGELALAPALLALTYLGWGALLRFLVRRRAPFPLAVALTAVLQEMAQAYLVVESGMPWPCRSLAFTAWESLTAASAQLGAYGLSFLAAMTSAWVSGLPTAVKPSPYRALHAARLVGAAIPIALLFGAAAFFGGLRVAAVDARIASGETITTRPLVIVQANVAQALKNARRAEGEENPSAAILSRHVRLTREALEWMRDHRTDALAVLWPETMIPYPFLDPALADRFPKTWESESNVVGHLKSAVPEGMSSRFLVGVNHYFRGRTGDHDDLYDYDSHDSLFLFDADRAAETPPTPDPSVPTWIPPWEAQNGRHDKVVLVPWGEYTPLGRVFPPLSKVREMVSSIPEITPGGDDQKPFLLGYGPPARPGLESRKVLAGTVICFEIAFPARCRAWRRAGATVLLNAGNYGWFGDTGMPAQVLALAKLRATELNVSVAIAGNTGPSAIVDPAGRVRAQVERDGRTQFVPGWCQGPLWADPGYVTTYAFVGDVPWLAGGVALVAWALVRGRPNGRDKTVTVVSGSSEGVGGGVPGAGGSAANGP